MAESTHIFNLIFRIIDKATKSLTSIDKSLKTVTKEVDKTGKAFRSMQGKFLGMGLGLTFFMFGIRMQLTRMLRLMFNIFEEASGSTSLLMEKFNMMRANLGAISISFFDAFQQSALFDFLISTVTSLTEWFINLDDSTQKWIAGGTIGVTGIIWLVQQVGQVLLAVYLASQLGILGWLGWASVAIIGLLAVRKVYKDFKSVFKSTQDEIAKDNELFWIDWRFKALNNILTVIKAIPKFLRKLQGIKEEESIAEQIISAGQERLRLMGAIPTSTIGPAGSYKEARFRPIGGGKYEPIAGAGGGQPTTQDNQDYQQDLLNLQREANKYMQENNSSLSDLKNIFSQKIGLGNSTLS